MNQRNSLLVKRYYYSVLFSEIIAGNTAIIFLFSEFLSKYELVKKELLVSSRNLRFI